MVAGVELARSEIADFVAAALAEDVGRGDLTTDALIPADTRFRGVLASRGDIVVAGMDVALAAFRHLDPELSAKIFVKDGDRLTAGAKIAEIEGRARAILTAERTALNILQHLSGIATLTRRYADALGKGGATLLDTRKTVPGMRRLAKYATSVGGAQNHRMGLDDGVLIKDNHVAVCGSVTEAVRRARAAGLTAVEVECDTLEQVAEALAAGASHLLLDNMPAQMQRAAVKLAAGKAKLEASGGVTLETIAEIGATGVDFVSAGRLTQSAPAADIGLDRLD